MCRRRWHKDKIGPDGELTRGWSRAVHSGPSMGLGRLTEKEARRLGWENFLSKLDAGVCAPHSAVTLGNFVDQRFLPEHVALLKRSCRYDPFPRNPKRVPRRSPPFRNKRL